MNNFHVKELLSFLINCKATTITYLYAALLHMVEKKQIPHVLERK